ncbi:hypothetical protein SAMN06265367_101742 [Algoriphagus winogradskyi]|uniref:Uncharacterized protein n=1 Tax=Algoriphagus winogradskyi TaxID=237017 RepID=A0ABY1NGD9_9BACT|nr:hypothetical protein SAMN06265367_101742 [Algoriphagus winogradskyi]
MLLLSLSLSANMKIQAIKEEVRSIVEAVPVIRHPASGKPMKVLQLTSLNTNINTQKTTLK